MNFTRLFYPYSSIKTAINERKWRHGHIFGFLLVGLLYGSSCQKEKTILTNQPESDLISLSQILSNNYPLTFFTAAMKQTGLLDTLQQKGPFTIFAPDNAAFDSIGIHTLNDLAKINKDTLMHLLRYHILWGQNVGLQQIPQNLDNQFTNGENLPLFLSRPVPGFSDAPPDYLTVNGVIVKKADIQGSNGVIHILSQVLKYPDSSIQSFLTSRPEYSYFVTCLKQFKLWDQLGNKPPFNSTNKGPFTVIAPTNTAFRSNKIKLKDLALLNPLNYSNVLFSPYILENNLLFMSDIRLFSIFDDQNQPLNYNFYKSFIPPSNDFRVDFQLSLDGTNVKVYFPVAEVEIYGINQLTSNEYYLGNPGIFNDMQVYKNLNNITLNGIVHPTDSLMVKPALVKK